MKSRKPDPNLKTFAFTDEEDATSFLGIKIESTSDAKHLRQAYLIRCILHVLRSQLTSTEVAPSTS